MSKKEEHRIEQLIDPKSDHWLTKRGYGALTYAAAIKAKMEIHRIAPWCQLRIMLGDKQVG